MKSGNLMGFVLAALLVLLASEPAMAQGIDLSPFTNILNQVVSFFSGPLGMAIATLAVMGIGLAWFMGMVDWARVAYVLGGMVMLASAGAIVGAIFG